MNKHYKITLLVLIFISAVTVTSIFVRDKVFLSRKLLVNLEQKATSTDAKIDFADIIKNKPTLYKKIELAAIAQTIDDCLLINSQETLYCAERLAVKNKNAELCKRLKPDWDTECAKFAVFELAASSKKPEDCLTLDSTESARCIKIYAQDYSYDLSCDIFKDKKQICLDVIAHNAAIADPKKNNCGSIADKNLKSDCEYIVANKPLDSDNDGIPDNIELMYKSDPFKTDTDGDGLSDYDEIKKYRTLPYSKDSDNDGLSDFNEVQLGTDPNKADTDGDGHKDGEEVAKGFNPCGSGLMPSREELKIECAKYYKKP